MGKRTANQRREGTNMQRLKANAERLKQQAAVDGIPQGAFDLGNGQMLPPFVPTNCNLIRLETTPKLFALQMNNAYGGGLFYFTVDQMRQFLDVAEQQMTGAQTGLVVANEQQMHQVAEQAQQLASGLVIPDGR